MAPIKSMIHATLLLLVCAKDLTSAEACGGFLKYCRAPFKHSGGVFRANCRTNQGNYVAAKVNLDNYLSNVNGNLVFGTGYSRSCQDFGYSQVGSLEFLVTANCQKFDGQLRSTSFDLNIRVSSRNGVMRWDTGTCRRRSLLQTVGRDGFEGNDRNVNHKRKLSVEKAF